MRHKDLGSGEPVVDPATDVVIDFTGRAPVDLGGLSLLLTAQQLAEEDHRRLWLRALPDRTWQILHALGLEGCFELFPSGGDPMN